ncbi:toll/interleukin-1 receptor domain-containing protein [uncultured Thiothrix sp.]|uniref:toll/interleukin-1 receptor domain-containing protein n=1 Tax=uncultured Thiothrix sp. TaxID=223185 RepID=UPI00261A2CA6|nr:toll/interleukin-1 receptor domain-containing protein [uncultured Thiothrix sp.]HMT91960.1 toll/interleukin-1 receptor domain-containing protein [Thiolinea sp.]
MNNPSYDFFISYSKADEVWVENIFLPRLQAEGRQCLTAKEFQLGHALLAELERGITTSHKVLLILSASYLQENTNAITDLFAMHYGLETGKWPVIPILIEKNLALPPRLRFVIPVAFTEITEYNEGFKRLLAIDPIAVVSRPLQTPTVLPMPISSPVSTTHTDSRRAFLERKLRLLQQQYDAETRVEEQLRLEPIIAEVDARLKAL